LLPENGQALLEERGRSGQIPRLLRDPPLAEEGSSNLLLLAQRLRQYPTLFIVRARPVVVPLLQRDPSQMEVARGDPLPLPQFLADRQALLVERPRRAVIPHVEGQGPRTIQGVRSRVPQRGGLQQRQQ